MLVQNNQLHPQLLSMSALNSLYAHISSPRGAMFTGNLGQFLVVNGATRKRLLAGCEREFGRATFKLGFDRDVEIIRVIPRYPKTPGADAIRYNPQTIVIYEDWETKEVGMLDLVKYHSTHQHFGFRYVTDEEAYSKLVPGAAISAGTVVAHSPLVTPEGDYMYGLETNVLFSSDPAVIEDGIKVSDKYLERIIPTGYETRVISFGKNRFPINLHGNVNHYKPFPDIGDRIHSDGLLSALREHDDILNVVNMTPSALLSPDYIYDEKQYAEPDALVVDIRVERNDSIQIPPVPVGMEDQLMKYWNADTIFYKKILDEYWALRHKRGPNLRLHPDFQRMVVEAINRVGADYHPKMGKWSDMERLEATKVDKLYRNVPLDAWRVEITYEHRSIPNVGFKLTDIHGGKGVICRVVPEEDMPIDDNGNRVEVIMDDLSTTRRLNPARFYEQYYNAASRDVVLRLRRRLGLHDHKPTIIEVHNAVQSLNQAEIEEMFDYVCGYYAIVSPLLHRKLTSEKYLNYPGAKAEHLEAILHDGIYLYFPTNNPIDRPESIRQIQKQYPPFITPVTFRGLSGKIRRSKQPMLIGSMYFMVLEKTAEDWSAVSSAKLQHYGTTARLTNHDKHSAPGRQQVTKTWGESEGRLGAATVGGQVIGDMMDATNNPLAHKFIQRRLLTAKFPTNVDEVLDRTVVPKGGHRPLSYVRHIFQCSGKSFCND